MKHEASLALLQLASLQEEDEAHCERWWKEHGETHKKLVMLRIHAMTHGPDPLDAAVGRFAQLAFVQAYLRHGES